MWGGMIAVESRGGWEDFYRDVARFEAKAASRAVRCDERNSTMLHRGSAPPFAIPLATKASSE